MDRILPQRRRFLAAGAAFAAAGLVPKAPRAVAAADTVSRIANYKGPDRQAMLVAGARNEGALTLYTVGTQIEPLIKRFEEIYPFIHVRLLRNDSAGIASRAAQEYQAAYFAMDGLELSSFKLVPLRDQNILTPFWSPEEASYEKDAIEPHREWVIVRESYTGIGYNTRLISTADAPKTYEDLLDPKWKGKLAISGAISTAANWVGTLVLTKGEDFVRRLGTQRIRVYNMTGRALANLMIAGEVPISPTIYDSHVKASRAKGAPLAWIAPGPVPVTDTAVAIASKAPHPHSMMLMIDFLMSKQGQKMYEKIGYGSARLDLEDPNAPKLHKLYLASRPNYVQEFADWERLYRQVFLQ